MISFSFTKSNFNSGLVVSTLVSDTASFYKAGDIDDPSNMADHKVYMFSGTKGECRHLVVTHLS